MSTIISFTIGFIIEKTTHQPLNYMQIIILIYVMSTWANQKEK